MITGLLVLLSEAKCQTEIFKTGAGGFGGWDADTLYIGAGLQYSGGGPVRVALKSAKTETPGTLYFINSADNTTIPLFSNTDAPGTVVDLSSLKSVPIGSELVFMYIPNNAPPRYTGPNRKADKYFTSISSDDNVNPKLRFGHRWSVAGRISASRIEVGFEDWDTPHSDMDFNDIIYTVENVKLLVFEKSAKTRSYIW